MVVVVVVGDVAADGGGGWRYGVVPLAGTCGSSERESRCHRCLTHLLRTPSIYIYIFLYGKKEIHC